MSIRKIISSAVAAAMSASMLTSVPAASAADTDIWNYAFEGSDIGGAITNYNEGLVITDPSDASNHVYNLGTTQLTKNVNDTVFTGKYKISFDFECVSYNAGNCTFSAYLYRNGAGYQAADYLSLTANGALQ
ncbi:MAG: hypothetical protein PUD92_07850, partial [Clostridiales bacterium]|nr:hypothetical protein [Clostridiales bacterium]